MVAALDQGVFKSKNSGATWSQTLKTKNCLKLMTNPSGQHVYLQCVKRTGLYASASWESVTPFTTDQIKQRMGSGTAGPEAKTNWAGVRAVKLELAMAKQERSRWNFAPWADHRSYMDLALARALDHFRKASHEVDPATPVGIEGKPIVYRSTSVKAVFTKVALTDRKWVYLEGVTANGPIRVNGTEHCV